MAMNLTVNHFPGGFTGHFNITIGGGFSDIIDSFFFGGGVLQV